jgi:hypothetical protein
MRAFLLISALTGFSTLPIGCRFGSAPSNLPDFDEEMGTQEITLIVRLAGSEEPATDALVEYTWGEPSLFCDSVSDAACSQDVLQNELNDSLFSGGRTDQAGMVVLSLDVEGRFCCYGGTCIFRPCIESPGSLVGRSELLVRVTRDGVSETFQFYLERGHAATGATFELNVAEVTEPHDFTTSELCEYLCP